MLNVTLLLFAFIISLCGAIYDWKKRRIPNWLTFGTFFIMLLISIFSFNIKTILNPLFGFFLGLALLIIPYALGGMGAGDVKLLGAIGSIVGYKQVVLIFLYSTVWGLFLSFLWILWRPGHLKFLITTWQVLPTVDKRQKFPYGVPIFLGTILYIVFEFTTTTNLHLTRLIWQ